MADLGTLLATGLPTNQTNDWDTPASYTHTGVDEGISSADGTEVGDDSNVGGDHFTYFTVTNTPADLDSMTTISVQVRYRVTGAQTNNRSLYARIETDEATPVVLTDEVTVATNITNTTASNSSVLGFTISGTPTKAQWDNAVVRLRMAVTKNKGGDTNGIRVDTFELTGTYAPAVATTTNQFAYRFRSHDNASVALSSTSWGVNQNTGYTADYTRRFRLRIGIEETNGGTYTETVKLQYRINTGSWTDVAVNAPGQSDDIRTAIDAVEIVENSGYTEGASITTGQLTGSSQTWQNGTARDTTISHTVTGLTSEYTELEWSLWFHEFDETGVRLFSDGDTIDFRVVTSAGGTLTTYTQTPTITVNKPAGHVGGTWSESPDRQGPWKDSNNNLYILSEISELNPRPQMWKSTDGGDTWAPVDYAGRPVADDLESVSAKLTTAGTGVHIVGYMGTEIVYNRFNFSDHGTPDDWAEIDTTVHTGLTQTEQSVVLGVKASDDLVVAYNSSDTIVFKRRVSGTWDTSATDLWTGDTFYGVTGALNSNDDRLYCFTINATDARLEGKTITAAGAIEDLFATGTTAAATGTSVDTNVGTSAGDRINMVPPVLWGGASPECVIGWRGNDDDDFNAVNITLGSGGSVGTIATVNDTGGLQYNLGSSRMPVAALVRDSSSGDIYAFWSQFVTTNAEDIASILYATSTNDGVSWGTPATFTTRAWGGRINWIRAEAWSGAIGVMYESATRYEQDTDTTLETNGGYLAGFIWYDELTLSLSSTVEPQPVSVTVTLPQAVRSAAAVRSPASVSVSVSLPQTTATGGTDTTCTPNPTTVSLTLPQAAASGGTGATATVEPVTVTVSLPQASGVTDVSATVTPTPITVASSLPQASATGGSSPNWGQFDHWQAEELPAAAPGFDLGGFDYWQASELIGVFPQPQTTVATGDKTVTPTPITVSLTLPQAAWTGDASRTPVSVSVVVSLPTPTITTATDVTATVDPVSVTVSLPTPTVTGSATRTLEPVTVAVTLPTPSVTGAATVTVEPVTVTLSLPQVDITTATNVTRTPEPVSVAVTLPTPSVTGTASISVEPVSVAVSLPQATPTTASNVTRTPDPVTVTLTPPTPTVSGAAVATVEPVLVSVSLPQVTLVTTASVTAAVEPVTVAITLGTPVILVGGDAQRSPNAVTVTLTLPTPTVTGAATATVDPVSVTSSLPQTTAVGGSDVTATVEPVSVAVSLPQATLVTGTSVTASPASVAVVLSLPQATATGGADQTAPVDWTVMLATVPTPQVFGSAVVTVEPVALAVTLPQATGTGGTASTIQLEPVTVTVSLPQVAITAGTSATATPQPVTLATALPTPTVSGAATRTVEPVLVSVSLPQSTAIGGTSGSATVEPVQVAVSLPQASATGGTGTIVTTAATLVSTALGQASITTTTDAQRTPQPVSLGFSQPPAAVTGTAVVLADTVNVVIDVPIIIQQFESGRRQAASLLATRQERILVVSGQTGGLSSGRQEGNRP